jgi:hypothetical protein
MKLVQEVKAKFPLPNYQEENLSLAFNLEISNLEHFFTSKYKAFLIDFS